MPSYIFIAGPETFCRSLNKERFQINFSEFAASAD